MNSLSKGLTYRRNMCQHVLLAKHVPAKNVDLQNIINTRQNYSRTTTLKLKPLVEYDTGLNQNTQREIPI